MPGRTYTGQRAAGRGPWSGLRAQLAVIRGPWAAQLADVIRSQLADVIRPWSVYVIRWPWYVIRWPLAVGRGPWFAGRGRSERLLTKGTYA